MTMFGKMMQGAARTRGVAKKENEAIPEMLMEHTPKSVLQHRLYYLEMQEQMVTSGALTHLPEHTIAEIESIKKELANENIT